MATAAIVQRAALPCGQASDTEKPSSPPSEAILWGINADSLTYRRSQVHRCHLSSAPLHYTGHGQSHTFPEDNANYPPHTHLSGHTVRSTPPPSGRWVLKIGSNHSPFHPSGPGSPPLHRSVALWGCTGHLRSSSQNSNSRRGVGSRLRPSRSDTACVRHSGPRC